MPSSAYATAYVAAGWIGCDSATSEAFWVLHQTESENIKMFYVSVSLPLLKAYLHGTTLSHATSLRQAYDMT